HLVRTGPLHVLALVVDRSVDAGQSPGGFQWSPAHHPGQEFTRRPHLVDGHQCRHAVIMPPDLGRHCPPRSGPATPRPRPVCDAGGRPPIPKGTMRSHVLAADGTALAFQASGAGRPLLLLAGQANDHTWWDGVRADFEPEHRTITM